MIAILLALLSIARLDITVELGKPERCSSSLFAYRGDRLAGGRARGFTPPRRVRPDDIAVAHRSRPLRQWVIVTNRRTGLSALAVVRDRGPFWFRPTTGPAFNAAREWRERRLPPGRFRNCLDVGAGLGALIGHDGMEPTEVRSVRLVVSWRAVERVVGR